MLPNVRATRRLALRTLTTTEEKMIELAKAKDILDMPMTAEVLRKYKYVFGTLYNTDASDDYTFQTAFCDFFRPIQSFPEDFKTKFFRYLEDMKKMDSISFRDALEKIYEIANRYEMAAASILVNCVNPRYPAWNKIIANGYFDLDEPSPEDASLEKCSKLYEDFEDKMYVYMNSPEGGALIKAFDAKFPNAEISNVSKVAIILWQGEI